MTDTFITIWFFIIFIPSIYLSYVCLQCFDYDKILKKGRTKEFKMIYIIICIIIAFLFASAFTGILERINDFITSVSS